jgi:phage shock protein PspC (stress-responsive transcriptional regulator)
MGEARSWFRKQGLVRPSQGRWLAGVCRGLADRVGIPAVVVRALFVISLFAPGPQFLVYLGLWLLMPADQAPSGV